MLKALSEVMILLLGLGNLLINLWLIAGIATLSDRRLLWLLFPMLIGNGLFFFWFGVSLR